LALRKAATTSGITAIDRCVSHAADTRTMLDSNAIRTVQIIVVTDDGDFEGSGSEASTITVSLQ